MHIIVSMLYTCICYGHHDIVAIMNIPGHIHICIHVCMSLDYNTNNMVFTIACNNRLQLKHCAQVFDEELCMW